MAVEQHLKEAFGDASPEQFFWQTRHPVVGNNERELVRRAFAPLGGKVLDFGCGEGATLHHLGAPAGATGVDLFEDKIEFARQQMPQCNWMAGSVYDLPFEDGSFDHVLVRDLVHHLDRPEDGIAEAARLLPSGGRIDVLEPCGRNPLVFMHALLEPAERGELRSTRKFLHGLLSKHFDVISFEALQPLPIHRLVFHHKRGRPELAGSDFARSGIASLERLFEFAMPSGMWAYLHLRAIKR